MCSGTGLDIIFNVTDVQLFYYLNLLFGFFFFCVSQHSNLNLIKVKYNVKSGTITQQLLCFKDFLQQDQNISKDCSLSFSVFLMVGGYMPDEIPVEVQYGDV